MSMEKERLYNSNMKKTDWRKWGPYLAERQWGTVREDYSFNGDAWKYFDFEQARSRAYRWGEDGIGGISDKDQLLCFSLSLWNGRDPFLKERLFGLDNNEGNHGEDVKEYYYYLDNTPTHSYMKFLYKYPLQEFPYDLLRKINHTRGKLQSEYELIDTGRFDDDKYLDVFIEYAKASTEDILINIIAFNRSKENAVIHLIPQLWFRNTWAWGYDSYKPEINCIHPHELKIEHKKLKDYHFYYENDPELLFCDNDTNTKKLFNVDSPNDYFKDGINDYIIHGKKDSVNPKLTGTKSALLYKLQIDAGKSIKIRLRLTKKLLHSPFKSFNGILSKRKNESDEFYNELQKKLKDIDLKNIQRQAFAGMLWNKQFYYYDVPQWLNGDPAQPTPPPERKKGRNSDWFHLTNADIISMPDKWEYPWYAQWDLAFHCITLAMVDASFAKKQLILLTREWYMHPNGQLPAYEWNFNDVNPPVHAWAAWRVYKIDKKNNNGKGDLRFLESVYHKLLMNFTWWVNRKDKDNRNIFQGGFLGLDNIGVFDRSSVLPTGGFIEQSDATSWMAMYCLNMMRISLELAGSNSIYQDLATKFFEHFLYIANAMINIGGQGVDLWDNEDEFFYDILNIPGKSCSRLRVRSMVGLIPLFAVEVLEPELMDKVPEFAERLKWFLNYRPDLANLVSRWYESGVGERRLLSLLRGHRMKRLLYWLLDENEFLSSYGVRALSKYYQSHPYEFNTDGKTFTVNYEPGESETGMFGGNSNWRGPIWFPVNFLIIESLQRFHHYYGDDFKIEYPTHSGNYFTIKQVSEQLASRLINIYKKNSDEFRAVYGKNQKFQKDPHFKDYILFYEYFHGDTGKGLGASHQTGWTGLIAKLLDSLNT